ncbi:MAG TPA: alpha-galactosidase [Petrimonas sp.]|uniref:alpha-galactosidase n=2 Tax=Petrimonas sp. TaxID=2023866 RepID=UPI00177873D8|nr:alpha-galactosidase [Petrimonas sp.]
MTYFTKIIILLGSVLLTVSSYGQINTGKSGKEWNITTVSSVYQLKVSSGGDVQFVYYGNKLQSDKAQGSMGTEVPVRGGYVSALPVLEVVFPDGVRDLELEYVSSGTLNVDGFETLKITQKDKFYPLTVHSYIRVLPGYDLIEKWVEVVNTAKKGSVKIENLQSGSIFLPENSYELTHFSGIWGNEFRPNTTPLTQGTKTIQVRDFKSFGSSTFFIRPEGENGAQQGEVWFGSLQYSGNWRVDFEKFFRGNVQVVGGINFWDQELYLKPGESFTAPRMVFGYSNAGTDDVTLKLTSYIREQLLPEKHRDVIRPVLYNSWYATAFDVNEEHQLALAKVAKEIGVEMFVIDDGWFKGRIDDKAGLGDWTVDKNKFPNGLKPMIDQINAMGLDFGIWIEPEMVNPNSDLYRAHPDWVFYFPNRQRHEVRNQLMLNLAREDVYQYVYKSISGLLRENNIKFIKWDMNKSLTDPGFMSAPSDEQRAVRIKYVENLYRLVGTLRKEFPDVWFEDCSSGGGRIDMGMARFFDFNWASDNTDPVERIFIQDSYLSIFPANTMISWITHEDWHGQNHPLEFKLDVAMAGVLGIGYDISKWNDEEKAIAGEKIARYKDIRKTVQFGNHYRLVSPYENNRSILQFVSKDLSESVVFVYNLAEYPKATSLEAKKTKIVRLKGLDPDRSYTIEGIQGLFKGDYLLNYGINFPVNGAFKSHIFKITAQ